MDLEQCLQLWLFLGVLLPHHPCLSWCLIICCLCLNDGVAVDVFYLICRPQFSPSINNQQPSAVSSNSCFERVQLLKVSSMWRWSHARHQADPPEGGEAADHAEGLSAGPQRVQSRWPEDALTWNYVSLCLHKRFVERPSGEYFNSCAKNMTCKLDIEITHNWKITFKGQWLYSYLLGFWALSNVVLLKAGWN